MDRGASNRPAAGPADVVVLGGGPAGAVAARGLVALGHKVTLIGAPRPYAAIEGLSERALSALDSAGCQQALRHVGPEVTRVATWNGVANAANRERLVERRVSVINMSIDGPPNDLLERAVTHALQEGVTIVAAAGNRKAALETLARAITERDQYLASDPRLDLEYDRRQALLAAGRLACAEGTDSERERVVDLSRAHWPSEAVPACGPN